jgi:serine/threonine protein kinase
MPPSRSPAGHCPPADDLDRLIHGRLSDPETAAVTDHVGHCTGCQQRMEELASEDTRLTDVVRQAAANRPPADSALWSALSAVEADVATGTFDGHGEFRRSGELKLDFLQPAETPGRLGRLGTFEIIRVIGRGGMGVVLHGHDPCLQRDVAVKVIDPQLADNEVARRRFCREARAAAAVTHENLVAVHQVDEDEPSGLPYLVMQLVAGESLDQRLRRVGKLSAVEVARLGAQAAAGLAAAHAGGLIHRDIKPGNILLEEGTDRVKLTDFGLARAAEDVKLTRTGFVAGSPLYMAPEQARGEDVDARADLFSLGTVLYEAASGTPPFDGKTPLVVLKRVADEEQPPLRTVVQDVPHWLSDVVDRLLAKDPADRFQTAAEVADIFAAELGRMQTGEVPAKPCGATSAYALRKQICWKSVAARTLPVVAGAVLGGLVVGLWPSDAPPARTTTVVSTAPAEAPGLEAVKTLDLRGGPVWGLAFSPADPSALVAGAEDGSVRMLNWRTGNPIKQFPRMGGNVWSADLSPDGEQLAVASDNSAVKVFYVNGTGEVDLPHAASTRAVAFSPDGTKLATGDRNKTVRVWDIAFPTQKPTEVAGHAGTVHGLAYSPDEKFLASAGSDGTVKVWALADGVPSEKPVQELVGGTGPLYAVAFSPDSRLVAAAGWEGTVRVWNVATGQTVHTLSGHVGDVWGVSFGAGGTLLASGGWDGTVRVWDLAAGKEKYVLRGTGRGFQNVRFAKDGTTLAAGSRDGTVRVWEVK